MNCMAGDLAVIVSGPANVGRLVEILHEPSSYGYGWWRARFIGSQGLITLGGGYIKNGEGNIEDHRLRPIRNPGDDARDESFAWAPSPNRAREILALPVREMIAPEVVQAISDLCAAAPTGQGRPL